MCKTICSGCCRRFKGFRDFVTNLSIVCCLFSIRFLAPASRAVGFFANGVRREMHQSGCGGLTAGVLALIVGEMFPVGDCWV